MSEESLSRALLLCLERAKLVVEPAGAAGVAAVLDDPGAFEPPVVVVLSGGNIDPLLLMRVLRHGLAVAGRYLAFRVRISDRPGALVELLTEVAAAGANVVEVEHVRTDPRLSVDEVEVRLQLETRGEEHCEQVLARLRRPATRWSSPDLSRRRQPTFAIYLDSEVAASHASGTRYIASGRPAGSDHPASSDEKRARPVSDLTSRIDGERPRTGTGHLGGNA